jgi:diphthine methyl ester synthase
MALARIATDTQLIVSGPLSVFATDAIDMGEPLHSFVLCGEMHEIEEQMYEHFFYTKHQPKKAVEEAKE